MSLPVRVAPLPRRLAPGPARGRPAPFARAGRMVSPLNPSIDTHTRGTLFSHWDWNTPWLSGGTLGRHLATEAGVTHVGDELVGLDSSTGVEDGHQTKCVAGLWQEFCRYGQIVGMDIWKWIIWKKGSRVIFKYFYQLLLFCLSMLKNWPNILKRQKMFWQNTLF